MGGNVFEVVSKRIFNAVKTSLSLFVLALLLLSGCPLAQGDSFGRSRPTESEPIDSARAAFVRDSFFEVQSQFVHFYKRFPRTVDSLTGYPEITIPYIYRRDGSGISEILRSTPSQVFVPFSLSSLLNRSLTYGLPLPPPFLETVAADHHGFFDPIYGTDILSASQLRLVFPGLGGSGGYRFHPLPVVSPALKVLWENGVFKENILDVRFARPISESTVLAIFSSYRHFDRRSYSHDYNNVYDFYASLVEDTSLLSNTGVYPLVNEHVSGVRFSWKTGADNTISGMYRYVDAQNDIVAQDDEEFDSLGYGTLQWERYEKWNNLLDIDFGRMIVGPSYVGGTFSMEHGGHKVSPAPLDRGERTVVRTRIEAGIGFEHDTLYVPYEFSRTNKSLYFDSKWLSWEHLVAAGYKRGMGKGPLLLHADVSGGQKIGTADTLSAGVTVWNAALQGELYGQSVRIFGGQGAIGFEPPYDIDFFLPGRLLDEFAIYGMEIFLKIKKAGLFFSFLSVPGIDSSSVIPYWPEGQPPYGIPSQVVTLAPVIGRIKGFALESKWIYSNTKPHLKAQVGLSYETSMARGNAHPRVDLVLNYWSERGQIRFGDPELWDQWSREFYELSLKLSMQIQTFRLFHKIDNILNRRIAYVPGYYMPGLTFRWGFNWLIPG